MDDPDLRTYRTGAGDTGFLMLAGSHPTPPYFHPPGVDVKSHAGEGYGLPLDTEVRGGDEWRPQS